MKLLTAAALLLSLAAPVAAQEISVMTAVSGAAKAATVVSPDQFGRRSGLCLSREGSPCGGV